MFDIYTLLLIPLIQEFSALIKNLILKYINLDMFKLYEIEVHHTDEKFIVNYLKDVKFFNDCNFSFCCEEKECGFVFDYEYKYKDLIRKRNKQAFFNPEKLILCSKLR